MATEKQIAANRLNAKKSTGPRTQNGKIKSSVNALRHGLYSEKYIATTEDQNTFRAFAASFIEEFEPQTASELELVDALIHTAWRRRRISSLISAHLNQALADVDRQDQRMKMQNQTQSASQPQPSPENTPATTEDSKNTVSTPAHSPSPESLTIRAYAYAEKSDPSLPRLESHETRLVELYLRLLMRLSAVQKERNKANLKQNPLLAAA
jgi:hypothetical protein